MLRIAILYFLFPLTVLWAQVSSFELRYFTDDPAANGITDFKGETAVFDTEKRVEFLNQYAHVAKSFFKDPALNTQVVTADEVRKQLEGLKQQPLPEIRKRILLNEWSWLGYKKGQHEKSLYALKPYQDCESVDIQDGRMIFKHDDSKFQWQFTDQAWRSSVEWRVKLPNVNRKVEWLFSDMGKIHAATIGIQKGQFYYNTAGQIKWGPPVKAGIWYMIKIEFDFAARDRSALTSYNLYINNELIADYVPMQRSNSQGFAYMKSFNSIGKYNTLFVNADSGVVMDDLWGVGYLSTGRTRYPYLPSTFLDEDFQIMPNLADWTTSTYNDSCWNTGKLPMVHGSERHEGEDLFLRKFVDLGDFEHARLNIETLDPSGVIWINGKEVAVLPNRHPATIDVTKYLNPFSSNIIAIRVDHFYLDKDEGEVMPHSYLDFNYGWFSGRISLDLVGKTTVNDIFVYTEKVGDPANLVAQVDIEHRGYVSFRGNAKIQVFEWFPNESNMPVAESIIPITMGVKEKKFETDIAIPSPKLWSPENPQLYKVRVELLDKKNKPIDDVVITTGIRTLSQKNGTFHLNDQPAMLNGAQNMGFRTPIEKLATWLRCAPEEWLMKELLMIKNMNGNLLRIHVHGWEHPARNVNDPRFAEIADQLGVCLIWLTPAWIRTGLGWGHIDMKGYPLYMRQVRNHPSIVMWEAANHTQTFKSIDVKESNIFCEQIYNMIYSVDPSRIISLNSYVRHLHYGNDAGTIDQQGNPIVPSPAWTAHGVTRGNQDSPTGYGKDWSVLRNWPGEYRQSFLDSDERAYFNFEHEESIGQPNWNLVKGKPWYHLQSYEWDYDTGSIGRRLTVEEWQASQAWQAFSAWEAMKKQRFLDYDGFSWCCLHGGANACTYKKPIIDAMGHAKLAFWVNKMIFQNTVAGSNNVDVAYGPEDTITPVVMNLGQEQKITLTVAIKDLDKKIIQSKTYSDINLKPGRTNKVLSAFIPTIEKPGYYQIEYMLEYQD